MGCVTAFVWLNKITCSSTKSSLKLIFSTSRGLKNISIVDRPRMTYRTSPGKAKMWSSRKYAVINRFGLKLNKKTHWRRILLRMKVGRLGSIAFAWKNRCRRNTALPSRLQESSRLPGDSDKFDISALVDDLFEGWLTLWRLLALPLWKSTLSYWVFPARWSIKLDFLPWISSNSNDRSFVQPEAAVFMIVRWFVATFHNTGLVEDLAHSNSPTEANEDLRMISGCLKRPSIRAEVSEELELEFLEFAAA